MSVGLQNGAIPCATIEDLLKKVDALSICVPTQYHLETAPAALETGVHVLIEKPICQSVKEAEQVLALIGKNQIVGVGQIERFNPIVPEIKRICRKPLYVEFNRHNPASTRITGSSVVEDLMIHDIDILRHVLFDDTYTLSAGGPVTSHRHSSGLVLHPHTSLPAGSRQKRYGVFILRRKTSRSKADFMNQEIFTYYKPDKYPCRK